MDIPHVGLCLFGRPLIPSNSLGKVRHAVSETVNVCSVASL